jgi:hypothetical protein
VSAARRPRRLLSILAFFLAIAAPASAQIVETAGSRSLGMGGAFVAVADDSSATWWNPAGLAAGPFFDLAIGAGTTSSGIAAATPPFGISYYRFEVTGDPIEDAAAGREDRRAEAPLSLVSSQLGVTLVQTLLDGMHAGATVKFVRSGVFGGSSGSTGDVDVGLLAVAGAFRIGGVARNLRAPVVAGTRLDRQVRIGVAFDGDRAGLAPLMVSIDADVRAYAASSGRRRVVAIGAERWFSERRLGVRAGARVNTAGGEEKAATAGVSVAVRAALYVDGHAVFGGAADDRGWGVAGRISF